MTSYRLFWNNTTHPQRIRRSSVRSERRKAAQVSNPLVKLLTEEGPSGRWEAQSRCAELLLGHSGRSAALGPHPHSRGVQTVESETGSPNVERPIARRKVTGNARILKCRRPFLAESR